MKRHTEDSSGCYLLCAERPLDTGRHPRHYIGSSVRIGDRIYQHMTGSDARLLQVFAERGIGWECVRTWITPDGYSARKLEKKLKKRKHYAAMCPHCGGVLALKRGLYVEVAAVAEVIPF